MDVWGWVLINVAALALFQFLVYRYLQRRDEPLLSGDVIGPRRDPGDPGDGDGVGDVRYADRRREEFALGFGASSAPLDHPGNERICPYCGTENEPEPLFTYCRNCVRRFR
jgi:hypothetical protein